jgi:hypothetical protein
MECTAPALVLVTPGADGQMQAEAFRGGFPPSAEQVYEWVKRSLPESRRSIAQLRPSRDDLARFLAPPWANPASRGQQPTQRQARAESAGRGRQLAKGCIFSARPISESLFARHMTSVLRDTLSLTTIHVEGGLHANTQAAELARAHGVTSLPAVAVWADTEEPYERLKPPQLFSISERPDAAARLRLLDELRQAALPAVPMLRAANYFNTCGPTRAGAGFDDDEPPPFCVLLFVDASHAAGGHWPVEAVAALRTLREAVPVAGTGARFAWVDAKRHEAFSRHILGGAGACASSGGAPGQPQRRQPAGATTPVCTDERMPTALVAVQSRPLSTPAGRRNQRAPGALAMRVSDYAASGKQPLGVADAVGVSAWVASLSASLAESNAGRMEPAGGWRKLKDATPPLGADAAPGALARLTVWFWSWGWAVVAFFVAVTVASVVYGDEIKAWADKQRKAAEKQQQQQQQRQQQQQQPQQEQRQQEPRQEPAAGSSSSAGDGTPRRRPPRPPESDTDADDSPRASAANGSGRASHSQTPNGTGAHQASPSASAAGIDKLNSATLDGVLERASYTLIFVFNAGVADRGTMHGLAAHFGESCGRGDWKQWHAALLDYNAEASSGGASRPALLQVLLPLCRTSPVIVLRKGVRVATFDGKPSVRAVEEWLGSLKMGEVSWATLEVGD